MRKFKAPVNTGGLPLHGERLNDELGAEIWDPIQAIMSRFDADTEGVIVRGCVLSANGGNFDMTAGIVYLNGEFMRVGAAGNQSFTSYIVPNTPVNIQKEFADGTNKDLIQEKTAGLSGSAPGAGQYIQISSLTPRRRWADWGTYGALKFLIDGGGTTIQTGQQGHQVVDHDCEIIGVELYASQSGSIVIDLWKDVYANFLAAVGDSIVAAAKPTISSSVKYQDLTLTGWTKILRRGEHLAYNVDSVTSIERLTMVVYTKALI